MIKEKLHDTRINRGLSQEELADLIGMSQSNYSRKENGTKSITDTEWKKIAKELNVKVGDIKEENTPNVVCKTFRGNNFSFNFGTIHNNMPEFALELIEALKKENQDLKDNKK